MTDQHNKPLMPPGSEDTAASPQGEPRRDLNVSAPARAPNSLRSPLVAGSLPAPGQDPQLLEERGRNKPGDGAHAKFRSQPPVSLSEGLPPNRFKARKSRSLGKAWLPFLVMMGLFTTLVLWIFVPKARRQMKALWAEAEVHVFEHSPEESISKPHAPGRGEKQLPPAAVSSKTPHDPSERDVEGTSSPQKTYDLESMSRTAGNCQKLLGLEAGATSAGGLVLADRLAVAECFMIFDHPAEAEEMLRPLSGKMRHISEAELNAQKSTDTLADALHVLTTIYVRQGKTREAEELLRGRCMRWSQSNTCVAKALVQAGRRSSALAMAPLFSSQGVLDGKARARLWLAGAMLASTDNKTTVADKRYEMALNTAPPAAAALRKQIFETYALDLYKRGELSKLSLLIPRAMAELAKLDAKGKLELAILGELSGPGDQRKIIRRLLTREDVTFRARGDIEMIDILGPSALCHEAYDDYLRLLDKTRRHYLGKYRVSQSSALKRLALWEVRTNLALSQWDKANNQLAALEKNVGKSFVVHHLRGVMLLKQGQHPRYYLMAAAEFQKALRLLRNWQSLYALGVSLLRGGQGEKVGLILEDLEKTVATMSQRYWTDMLKAQWYEANEKWLLSLKILTSWSQKQPGYLTPHLLLVDLYRKMGKTAEAEREEDFLRELTARPRPETLAEKLGSPLDVLALERRPGD